MYFFLPSLRFTFKGKKQKYLYIVDLVNNKTKYYKCTEELLPEDMYTMHE